LRNYANDLKLAKGRKLVQENLLTPPTGVAVANLSLEHIEALVEGLLAITPTGRAREEAFLDKLQRNLALPLYTPVSRHMAKLTAFQLLSRGGIKAICTFGSQKAGVPLEELSVPTTAPPGAEWIEAYRHWKELSGKRT
jgi:hypothetical protein